MISKFHYITQDLENFSHAQLAEFACKGGADWIQLRVKNKSFEEWKKIAEETKTVCKKFGAKLIINDNVQIAKEISADGVHLGKEDMNPKEARKFLGKNFIIGGTANTIANVKQLIENGVDYIGLGPFRFTETKKKLSPVLGLDGIKKIMENVKWLMVNGNKIPIVAIGGIQLDDVETLMNCGIHGIAVSSEINLADNKTDMTRKFLQSQQHFIRLFSAK